MNASAKQLYDHTLHLPDSERAELAALLIESLDPAVDQEVDEAWDAEIKRRVNELDSGAVTAVPWPEARRMILGLFDGPTGD
ncbi:MAG: addiction module protein [Planctomycetota bacterium]